VLAAALFAASCGRPPLLKPPGADIDWAKAEPVRVVATEYRFEPDHLRFRRGVPYRLHLDNTGAELHEFTAPAFFRTVTLLNPEALADGGDVVLQPKQQKDVFFVPRQPGRYPLACADHDWEGMVGDITVE
jgi:uncharacterized cupredoxin-like copper-binding protein